MARTRKNADLGSREARRRLKGRPEPYWCVLERGLSLGYRKSAEGGAWLVRRYDGGLRKHFERRIATADDYRDADGTEVLTFQDAQRQVLTDAQAQAVEASTTRYSVADAVHDYVDWAHRNRKSADDTEAKLAAYVLATPLAEKQLADLQPSDLEEWLKVALKRRRRTRRKASTTDKHPRHPQRKARTSDVEAPEKAPTKAEAAERERRRKVTLNRVINALKACLNHAAANGKPGTALAWKRLRKFKGVDFVRTRWLTVDEAQRLQNSAPAPLRDLIAAGLNTGCRAGELLALRASDYDARSRTLLIADSKSSKPRRVPLTQDGVALFEQLVAGKAEDEALFVRADGSAWYRLALVRAMRAACTAGKIRPAATFHTLRHTYASHLVQAGVPLMFVAETLGHGDTRMVSKHYGHLAPSAVADAIRAALPKFGVLPSSNVTDVRARK